jgi:hypothetical protein
MKRSLLILGVCLAVAADGGMAQAQSALGGAIGLSATAVLRDSPRIAVQDHAGMFKPDAVRNARAAIQQFRKGYHRDLFIETFDQVPAADQKRVASSWSRQRERYFAEWAAARAKAIGIDGVYVLICERPKQVYVLVYPNTAEQAFTEDNAAELRKHLERELVKSRDDALADVATYVRNKVQENLEAQKSEASSIRYETIVAIIAAVVGFWLLLSLVRAVLQRAGGSGDPAHGSLTAGFFGAMFGTAAGHWVYDRLFRAHPPAAPQAESELLHSPPTHAAEPTSEGQDQEEPSTWGR